MALNLYGRTDLTRLPDCPDGTHIDGSIDLTGCTALRELPDGLSVGGGLNLTGCTALERLPAGLTVGGALYLLDCTALERLPDGLSVGGMLDLRGCTALERLPAGLTVGGTLDLTGCTAVQRLPDDISVGRTLDLDGCTALRELPDGLRVGGSLYLTGCTALRELPDGLSVSSWLVILGCTALERLPDGLSARHVHADGGMRDAAGRVLRVIDDICCVVVGERIVDGTTVLSVREPCYSDGDLVGEQRYVAIDGEIAAHGETVAEALEDLSVKRAGAGDLSAYRGMPMDTRKTPDEWAAIYRAITGACRQGVRDFIAQQGPLAETYALSEILDLTAGSYGADRFAAVVGG